MVHEHLQDSLELCARYEFLKRNPVSEAHRNFSEMLTSEKVDNVSNAKPNCQPVFTNAIKFYGTFVEDPEEDVNPEEDSDTDSENLDPPKDKFEVGFYQKKMCEFYEMFYKEEHETESRNEIVSASGVLERLNLRTLSTKFKNYAKSRFPINRLRTIRAYGKIKVQFYDKQMKQDQNLEYWRCDTYKTLIWRNHHARLDGSRRFQQVAAHDVFQMTRNTQLERVEFKTEKYNSWNLAVQPFDNFYKILADRFNVLNFKLKVKKFSMDITWFGDKDPYKDPLFENGKKIICKEMRNVGEAGIHFKF
ncbi:hypothetical protein B9Z55_012498 [Caenorhabditis nigoni]|uniref:DUF38 domain-containing protein n=1 Tax=Caenorhabditis nigoni TaxID=1611254 RepID=A0A2G5TXM5_9PELO|nr:hypothetical protein B9Z55_012498 [Caenorhabditis nigoni]